MSFVTALNNSYEYALKNNLVGNINSDGTVLLPLFHTNLRSDGRNIINISIDNKSNFISADYEIENKKIIFPVTMDSVARSGKYPPPHPLVDKLKYVSNYNPQLHTLYLNELSKWINCAKNDSLTFLTIIKKFIVNNDIFKLIASYLFETENITINEWTITEKSFDDNGEITEVSLDYSDFFITFTVINFKDNIDFSVSTFKDLQSSYIDYVNDSIPFNGICNISGEEDYLLPKHRGLLGNAKIISVSNNKETYFGRFKIDTDVINIGYNTSEKLHLFLKFLLENKNTHQRLGSSQYLLNWFSEDIENNIELDLTKTDNDLWDIFTESEVTSFQSPASLENRTVSKSFLEGRLNFDPNSSFYIALIDKVNNGRIAIKLFKELTISHLVENLKKWKETYYWYDKNSNQYTPSLNVILNATYGVERSGRLEVDNDNFKKMVLLELLNSIISGTPIPYSIINRTITNINNRQKYDKTWSSVLRTSLAVLNNSKEGEFSKMVDNNNLDRSYLLGRLLALYELIESSTYNNDNIRFTNAEKFWNSYTNKPASTLTTFERVLKSYEERLMKNNIGLYKKLKKEKDQIISLLTVYYENDTINDTLSYAYIFGYIAEKNFIYTKSKNNDDVQEEV